MTIRRLMGYLLLAITLTGCIVVPARPVVWGPAWGHGHRPHRAPSHHHHHPGSHHW